MFSPQPALPRRQMPYCSLSLLVSLLANSPIWVQVGCSGMVIPWSKAANDDGTFRSDDELRTLYGDAGVDFGKDTIAYCRIGERSAHTWFVLHEILDQANVKNYDGSWTEYGSLVGVPISLGADG